MIPGAVHRSPDIYVTSEETPGKRQLEDDGCANNGVPFPQMRSVGSGREKGGKK